MSSQTNRALQAKSIKLKAQRADAKPNSRPRFLKLPENHIAQEVDWFLAVRVPVRARLRKHF